MITTTTPGIDGKTVDEYLGIVTGEAIIGANIFKDILATVRDVVGGRSASYEKALRSAREEALREMVQQARDRDGNAVVGVDIDYEVLGTGNGMLMVTAAGTAVKVS